MFCRKASEMFLCCALTWCPRDAGDEEGAEKGVSVGGGEVEVSVGGVRD